MLELTVRWPCGKTTVHQVEPNSAETVNSERPRSEHPLSEAMVGSTPKAAHREAPERNE